MTPEPQDPDARAIAVVAEGPRRARWPWVAGAVMTSLLIAALAAGAIWVRLSAGPISLPSAVQARVVAEIDHAMAMGNLSIADIAVTLPDAISPEILLSGIALRDSDGRLRAGFPDLRVALSPRALLRGDVRPTRIAIDGAGLRLRRDADGVLDLDLTPDGQGGVSLAETLARVDAMFAAPAFERLEAVTGSGLDLTLADALSGQVYGVRDAVLRLQPRDDSLTLTLGGELAGSRDARISIAVSRRAAEGRTDAAVSFASLAARDLEAFAPTVGDLSPLDAPIGGQVAVQLRDDGTPGDLTAALEIGAGTASWGADGARIPFDRIEIVMRYAADAGVLQIERAVLDAPALRTALVGRLRFHSDGTGLTGQLRLEEIDIAASGPLDAPLTLDGALVDLRLTRGEALRVEIGQAVVEDGDLRLHVRGSATFAAEGRTISLDAEIPRLAAAEVLSYWPERALRRTRAWVAENVLAGTATGVNFAWRQRPGAAPVSELQFDFTDTRIRAVRSLPPIEDAAGYLSLIGRHLIVRVDRGTIPAPDDGAVALAGTVFQIPDFAPRPDGPAASADLRISSELHDLLALADAPPLSLFAGGSLRAEAFGSGRAELSARLDFRVQPRMAPDALMFDVDGTVTGYRAETLVSGRVLTAPRLQIRAAPDAISVSGRATLDGVAMTGQWGRALGAGASPISLIEARAVLSRETLNGFGITLPPELVTGQTEAEITVTLAPDTPPLMRLTSDLAGISLALPQVGWRLEEAQTGALSLDMRLGDAPAVTAVSLEAPGIELRGRIDLAPDGGLQRLAAQRFRLGGWLDVTGALTGRGAGLAPGIEITGGTLDLRRLPPLARGDPARIGPLRGTLDRLQITDGIALTGLTVDLAKRSALAGLGGDFVARVNGDAAAAVSGAVGLDADGPRVRIVAPDGGAVLRAANLTRNIYGGATEVTLVPTATRGHFDGQLRITAGARMRDGPAIAEMLNAISVVGLLDQLDAEGVSLGEVAARFRISPDAITLSEATALGPAIGVSMDGIYRTTSRAIDLQGVVSPFYFINGAMGALFTERQEGLFGVSYRITGTPEAPEVTVNPLSILAPGFFREIFRQPAADNLNTP